MQIYEVPCFFLFNEFTNIFVPASIWLRFAFGT